MQITGLRFERGDLQIFYLLGDDKDRAQDEATQNYMTNSYPKRNYRINSHYMTNLLLEKQIPVMHSLT